MLQGLWTFAKMSINIVSKSKMTSQVRSRANLQFGVCWLLLFLVLCSSSQIQAQTYTNTAGAAGVATAIDARGLSSADYDGDGDLDIYVAVSNAANVLYRNNGDNTFTDVAGTAGVNNSGNGQGVSWGDYDGDGDLDIYVTNNVAANLLYRNNGDGTFTDQASAAGVQDAANQSNSAPWADFDDDGDLDFYLANNSTHPNRLYRNNGDGTFTDIGGSAGIDDTNNNSASAWNDFDEDGDLDIYVNSGVANKLYRNNGDNTFTDIGSSAGVATTTNNQGISWFDFDNDGDFDLFLSTNGAANILYRNNGDNTFTDIAGTAGVDDNNTGRGVSARDYDHDGDVDLYVANFGQANLLYRNNGDDTFTDIASTASVQDGTNSAMSGVWLDYDDDGDPDLFVANVNQTNVLYQSSGTSNKWLKVDIKSAVNPPGGLGARVSAVISGLRQVREPDGGSGYLSQVAQPIEFGFGATSTVDSLIVDWPSGLQYVQTSVATDQTLSISEAPVITSLSLTSGSPGASLTINGTNFDPTHGNNTVFIGGIKATSTAGDAESITVTIPSGSTFGPVTVQTNSLSGQSKDLFLTSYAGVAQTITSNTLSSGIVFTTGSNPEGIGIADFDADGKPDLAIANQGANTVSTFKNQATSGGINSGSFAGKVDLASGTSPQNVEIGDLDGDGLLDMAVVNNVSNTVSVYHNTSSGSISFATKVDFTTGTSPAKVAIGDLDGDGKPDLVVTNNGGTTISILRNTSVSGTITTGSFATKVDVTLNSQPWGVGIGDLDGDGVPDVAVTNYGSDNVSVLRNTSSPGSLSFATKVDFATDTAPLSIVLSDLDGDGKLDMATSNNSGASISTLRNTGSSGTVSFAAKTDYAVGTSPRELRVGDFDGDGKPDLVVANLGPDNVSLLHNTGASGTISFAAKVDFSVGSNPRGLAVADLDGDRRPEVVVGNNGSTTLSVLYNIADPPTISSLSATSGKPGDSITITGANFYAVHSNNTVFIGGIKATTTAGNTTSLTVTIPDGATFGPVTVVTQGGRTAHSEEMFLPTYSGLPSITTGTMAAKVDISVGVNHEGVVFADIDGDGKPDMITAQSNNASIYENQHSSGAITTGSFAAKVDFATGTGPNSAGVGDIDNDGDLDIVTPNWTAGTVSVLTNTTSGAISFATKVDLTVNAGPARARVHDLDGDGNADIVALNNTGGNMTVFRNVHAPGTAFSTNSMVAKTDYATLANPSDLDIGDIDGDGLADVVVGSTGGTAHISVFHNTSNGGAISLATKDDFVIGAAARGIALGDIDGDGKLDISATSQTPNTVSVYRNTATSGDITGGSLAAAQTFTTGTDPFGLALGDIDGDGKLDIVVANEGSDDISIFRNTATSGTINGSSLATKVDFASGDVPASVGVADIDGDDKPDIAVTNVGTGDNIAVYQNLNGDLTTFTDISGTATVNDAGAGQGAAFGDYDGDGDLDLFLANNGSADRLYRNNDGVNTFTDQGGTTADTGSGRGGTFVDFDNDGDLDLFVVRGSTVGKLLYRNDGSGVWNEVASGKGITTTAETYTASWADYDHDGDVDLFMPVYGAIDILYQNDGTGSFTEVASTAGVNGGGNAESAAWADYNNDGLIDLYVAINSSSNLLYRNDGDGSFSEDASTAGVQAAASATISASWADYNDDGYMDLFVGNNSSTTDQLFTNDGDGTFTDDTIASGVLNTTNVVGVAWADYDNDGDMDLFANGNGVADRMWYNNGDGTFIDVASDAGLTDTGTGRGAVWGDIDNNGTQDLYVVNNGSANLLYLNNGHPTNRYLRVALDGVDSNKFGYGAEVTLSESGVFRQTRTIDTGSGWNTQGAEVINFGIADVVTVDSVIVKWPSGRIQVALGVNGNQTTTVTETGGLIKFSEVGATASVGSTSNDLVSSWADYDADGDLDLYVGSDAANTLYDNDNDGTFTDANIVLLEDAGNARATIWGDYDNDGDLDLFVNNNASASKLFRNDGGGSFNDQTATAGVGDTGAGAGAAWGDYDNDGDIDLFMGKASSSANILYGNDGDGTFTAVGGNEADGTNNAYGVAFADYDDDGDLDLYVANDSAASALFRNDDGVYNDTNISAVEVVGASPGVSWADYDNDGDLDLYITSGTNDDLFRNDGSGTFVPVGLLLGVVDPANNLGSSWADYDNDGDLDLFVSTASTGSNKFYLNNGDATFGGNVAPGAGLFSSYGTNTYGASWADYDNDGDLDLYVPRYGAEPNKLFRNDNSNGKKYLIVNLVGSTFGDATGAVVRGWVGGNQQRRDVDGGSGYQSQGSHAVEFGFDATATLDSLVIDWPSGKHFDTLNVATDQVLTIEENLTLFTEIATSANVNSSASQEGVAMWDFDGDGDLDIFVAGQTTASLLYQNNGSNSFADVASSALITGAADHRGVAVGDYDGDGDLDLYQTLVSGNNQLYRNNGNNTFTELASGAGVAEGSDGLTASWVDFDNDGDLDLSEAGGGHNNRLYRNDGGGTFNEIGGIGGGTNLRYYGMAWGDFDDDGDLDLYLKDSDSGGGFANGELYRNDGGGTFSEIASSAGVLGTSGWTWSANWADYDNDGDLDLYVANHNLANNLYRNNGDNTFTDVGSTAGVASTKASSSPVWGDYDVDGDLDLFIGTDAAADEFFLNNGDGTFVDFTSILGLGDTGAARGVAFGDTDNDGDLDLFVVRTSVDNLFYRNENTSGRYLNVKLTGITSNSSAIGAKVEAWDGGNAQRRDVDGGSGYQSQPSLPVEFGFAGNPLSIDSLVVDWPSGSRQVFTTVNTNQTLSVAETATFMEVANAAGVDDALVGISVAWADFDNDNDLDFYVVNSGAGANKLYSNDNDGTFTDVSGSAGVGNTGNGRGGVWGDIDNDGDLDLYVVNTGGANVLYRNNGNNTFTDVTASPVDNADDGKGASWADYDLDGDLDLYVANYGQANVFFQNDGAGTFTDVTTAAGLGGATGQHTQPSWADYDGDGDLDLYVTLNGANLLYKNAGDGSFVDDAATAGVADAAYGLGASWADADNDGDWDLYVANNSAANKYYTNDGDGTFTDATVAPLNDSGDGYAVAWGDYDNDGDADLFVAHGGSADRLFQNDGGTFTDVGPSAGVDGGSGGRGAAWGDYDGDGDLDLYLVSNGSANYLYMNDGSPGDWLKVELDGVVSNGYGVGATIKTYTDAVTQIRMVDGGSSYYSQEPSTVSFGLNGFAAVDSVDVIWPNGFVQRETSVTKNTTLTVTEETGPEGLFVRGLDFDGVDDMVVVPDAAGLDLTTSLSLEAWVKVPSLPGTSVALVSKARSSVGSGFALLLHTGGVIKFNLNDNTTNVEANAPSGTLVANQWMHIAGSWDGTTARLYVDGQLMASAAASITLQNSTEDLRIGQLASGLPWALTGSVDEVRVWSDARTQTEIAQNMNNIVAANEAGLVAYWRLDEGVGVVAKDETGNGHDGALTNMNVLNDWIFPDHKYEIVANAPSAHTGILPGVDIDGDALTFSIQVNGTQGSAVVTNASTGAFTYTPSDGDGETDSFTYRITDGTFTLDKVVNVVNLGTTFTDVSSAAGLATTDALEAAAWGDYDGDGDPDLLVTTNGTTVPQLYRNNGDNTFTDRASAEGLTSNVDSRAAVWGDYDNDGDLDLYIAVFGSSNELWRNDGGTFNEVGASASANAASNSYSASWADYNQDGFLDLYVGQSGAVNVLYSNDGDATFTISGLAATTNSSLSQGWADFDGDGDLDLYLNNDSGANNILYRNDDGTAFNDIATAAGVNDGNNARGMAMGDYDNDGDTDIYITTSNSTNILYRNNANSTFTNVAVASNTGIDEFQRGALFVDLDNDGDLDLLSGSNRAFLNNNDGTFGSVGPAAGLFANDAVAISGADYDADGDVDLFYATTTTNANVLYRNNGNANKYLHVNLVGSTFIDASRAVVRAWVGGNQQVRDVDGGGTSFLGPKLWPR